MTDAEVQAAVASTYLALAELFDGAPDTRWDASSLCAGWRVREVIAHVTMPARYSGEAFMAELERCAFDFTRFSNEVASRDAQLPAEELVANLRADGLHHWTPPGGGLPGALNHVVIHGLDVTVPLGVTRCCPDDALRAVLDQLAQGGHENFGIALAQRRLEATDMDWSYGSGEPLRGSAEDLALTLCGRAVPEGRLQGPALHRTEP
jgi:uncharacterized protein (TIGR03083 family)